VNLFDPAENAAACARHNFGDHQLTELLLVEEVEAYNSILFSRSNRRKSRRESPFHADQLRVGFSQVLRVTEGNLWRNLLL